jgi:hypothetical protein
LAGEAGVVHEGALQDVKRLIGLLQVMRADEAGVRKGLKVEMVRLEGGRWGRQGGRWGSERWER